MSIFVKKYTFYALIENIDNGGNIKVLDRNSRKCL
jgi:hypothetical protein